MWRGPELVDHQLVFRAEDCDTSTQRSTKKKKLKIIDLDLVFNDDKLAIKSDVEIKDKL